MALTPNEKKDLRQAWKHLDNADDCLAKMPSPHPGYSGIMDCRKELSDARRLIDRVEQERQPFNPSKDMLQWLNLCSRVGIIHNGIDITNEIKVLHAALEDIK